MRAMVLKHRFIITCLISVQIIFSAGSALAITDGELAPLADDAAWFHLLPSNRPAYIGIHGGTAPITLLRGPDGMVYALSGQTGNDFILALRNGSKNSKDTLPPPTVEVPITKSSGNYHFSVFSQIEINSSNNAIYERWANSPQWTATLAYSAAILKEQSHERSDIVTAKPENYPDVVFTSAEAVSRLAKAEIQLAPFGLSVDDLPTVNTLLMPDTSTFIPIVTRPTPLVLSDYRKLLKRS